MSKKKKGDIDFLLVAKGMNLLLTAVNIGFLFILVIVKEGVFYDVAYTWAWLTFMFQSLTAMSICIPAIKGCLE